MLRRLKYRPLPIWVWVLVKFTTQLFYAQSISVNLLVNSISAGLGIGLAIGLGLEIGLGLGIWLGIVSVKQLGGELLHQRPGP